MKKSLTYRSFSRLILSLSLLLLTASLQSCSDWEPGPPPGYGSQFYDSALTGSWELVAINGQAVASYNTNFLKFYGNGRGTYSYYYNGSPYTESMSYWCEESYNTVSNYQINISYNGSTPSTMNYWFAGNYLYLQWHTDRGITRYTYLYTNRLPYPFAPEPDIPDVQESL